VSPTPRLQPVAVLVGLCVDNLATAMLVTLATAAWTGSTDSMLAAVAAIGAMTSVLGGYAAASFAGSRELPHALLVGIGDVVVGIAGMLTFGDPLPLWYEVVAFLAVIPATLLGGVWARRARLEATGEAESTA
jgi:hypothetical protein